MLLGSALAGNFMFLKSIARARVPGPLATAAVLLTALYFKFVRPWHLHWGSRPGEDEIPLPGDGVLEVSGTQIQHAVDIDAPAEEVWPWIAQIGQERGGFYSYTWLENLAGCEMENADRIHPEWQEQQVGNLIRLHPATGLEVSVFEPGKVLGMKNWGNFVVQDQGPDRSRLIVRGRIKRGFPAVSYAVLMEIPHFVMERKMLLEIKRLAEAGQP